jgi:hypothetical protein
MRIGQGRLSLKLEGVVKFPPQSLVLDRGVLGEHEGEVQLGEFDKVEGF